jgi:outer membrane immunogenic protein
MKSLLRAVALLSVVSGPAFAADLAPAPMPMKAPPAYVPAYNWTGFYVGGNVGGGWENTQTNYGYTSFAAPGAPGFEDVFGPVSIFPGGVGPLNIAGQSAVASALAEGFIPGSLGNRNTGTFVGGAQVGYNWQFNKVVAGLEADIDWLGAGVRTTNFSSGVTIPPPVGGFLTNTASSSAGLRWLGTVRGRLGWTFDRALVYATGGLAYGDAVASSNAAINDGSNIDLYGGGASGIRTGYAIGGGLDYAVTNNVSLRGEYLYYNLGTATYAVAPLNTVAMGEGITTTASQKFDGSIARFGVNYKIGP